MNRKLFVAGILLALGACTPKKANDSVAVDNKPVSPSANRQYLLSSYQRTAIIVKGHKLDVYIARSAGEMEEGLMWTEEDGLGADEGMIFVFPDSKPRSFWMHNTLIPLDIAYLDSTGKILNVRTMQPLDESSQPSEGAARYAVEAHAGWFGGNGVGKGMKFNLGSL